VNGILDSLSLSSPIERPDLNGCDSSGLLPYFLTII